MEMQYVSYMTHGSTSAQRLRSLLCCCWRVFLTSGCWWRRSISPSALHKMLLWSWWAEVQANHSSLSISSFSLVTLPAPSHPNLHSTHAHPVRVSAWHSGWLQAKARPAQQKQQCRAWSWQAWDEQHESSVPSMNHAHSVKRRLALAVMDEVSWPHIATSCLAELNRLTRGWMFILFSIEMSAIVHKRLYWKWQLHKQNLV